jgi:methyl-accepting chemotaxis protein
VQGIIAAANESVAEVGKGLDTIAVATSEQRQTAAGVAASIEKIAAMAQANSDAVDKTAAAARSLQSLAADMQGAVGRFKT